jgi:hypothetical protein
MLLCNDTYVGGYLHNEWHPATRPATELRFDRQTRRESLRLIADWLLRTTQETHGRGCGYRDLQLTRAGEPIWRVAHSCTGERINVLLAAHEWLSSARYLEAACRYADAMIDDPQWGIYDGPMELMRGACHCSLGEVTQQEEATYATVYSMRLPRAFHALHRATGEARYSHWFDVTAEHLLAVMLPMGLPIPWFHWNQTPSRDLAGQSISVRVGYLAGEFAWLANVTGDGRFRKASEQIVEWMGRCQDASGGWPETIYLDEAKAKGEHRSNHMACYVLTGLSRAAIELNLDSARTLARRGAEYLANQFERYHRIPAIPDAAGLEIRPDWALSPMYDGAFALLTAGQALGETRYLRIADELAFQFLSRQAIDESHPSAGTAPYFSPPTDKGYLRHPHGGWNCDGHSTTWMGWFCAMRDVPMTRSTAACEVQQPLSTGA